MTAASLEALTPVGGSEGCRTPYLLHAMQALSQLSYEPEKIDSTRPGRHQRLTRLSAELVRLKLIVDRTRIELAATALQVQFAPLEHVYPKLAPINLLQYQGIKAGDRLDSHQRQTATCTSSSVHGN